MRQPIFRWGVAGVAMSALSALAQAPPTAPATPVVAVASAPAARFHWQAGQVHTYRIAQTTQASEEVPATSETPAQNSETATQLNLVKRWQVASVDAQGVATLHMSLAALQITTRKPDGGTIAFDSARTDNPPEMHAEMSKYLNTVLAIVRLDGQGKLVEIKESKFGPASRFECELPFRVTLPDGALPQGGTWERTYTVKLDPPQGTGEKYEGKQSYTCSALTGTQATVSYTTSVVGPQSLAEQVPLLPLLAAGEVVFDTQTGCMMSATLSVDKELKEHNGPGSVYRYRSTYSEIRVSEPNGKN
jgi:hypothetical protein